MVRIYAILMLLLPTVAGASVPDLVGYGARATAMVGGVATSARGADAVYYNPAALVHQSKATVSMGFVHSDFELRINGAPHPAPAADALYFGFGLPLPFGGALSKRIAIGASFVVPRKSIFMAKVPAPGSLNFPIVETRAQTVSLLAGMGIKINTWLSIGGGIMALSALDGAIVVSPDPTGRIGSEANDELVVTFSPLASIYVQLPGKFRFAASGRAASSAHFDLPIDADLGERFPIAIPRLHILGTAQFDPAQFNMEVDGSLNAQLRMSAGLNYKFWSGYPVPLKYAARPEAHPQLPDPGFEDVADLYGTLEARIRLGPWTLNPRGGYRYSPSPVPEQTGLYNHLDSDRHTLGIGLGLKRGRVEANLGLQWFVMQERMHNKDEAQLVNEGWVGPPNPGIPQVEHKGSAFSASFDLRLAL